MNLIHIGIIVTAVIATLLILLQERGDGAGSIFGGGNEGGAYQHRRGAEKFMFVTTIIFVASFAGFCILNLAYPQKPVSVVNDPSITPVGIKATDANGNPVDVQVTPVAPQQ